MFVHTQRSSYLPPFMKEIYVDSFIEVKYNKWRWQTGLMNGDTTSPWTAGTPVGFNIPVKVWLLVCVPYVLILTL